MHFLNLLALALLHENIKEWACSLVVRALAYQRNTSAQCKIVHCAGYALVILQRITCKLQQVGVYVGVKETWPARSFWRECGVTTRGCGVRW